MSWRILGISWFILAFNSTIMGQSTALEVYKILQTNCTFSSCHNNASPVLGLDLEGSGPDSVMQVLASLVGASPQNVYATEQGFDYITPGDLSTSFLFRKINNGLDPTIDLHSEGGDPMPQSAGPLHETDIELIRQWILHGAPLDDGEYIDTTTIHDFYTNNGIQSVPNPALPPDPEDGFQIHLGPFFIPPGEEDEIFIKYDPQLDEDLEITKVEVFMGDNSHHFILYKFFEENQTICGFPSGGGADDFPAGFRGVNLASHTSANFQFGAQNTEAVELPYNTAFAWEAGAILDLNSHYINFSPTQVLAAEVYINVYTQPAGTAAQEMEAIMIPNLELDIPNDGQEVTFSDALPVAACFPQGMYLWATTCHTHALGQDYDIYVTDAIGTTDLEHIYDGSCFTDGVPGCATEFYDYQHPPTRVFDDYYWLSNQQGIRHEASYINNGPEDVGFGLTSDDEMMLYFFFYVLDTTGLTEIVNSGPVAEDDTSSTVEGNAINIDVLENDNDIDGALDPNSVMIITGPSNGDASVNVDGSILYEPDDDFFGQDEFVYIVCDNGNPPICDTATVEVSVAQSQATGLFGSTASRVSIYPNPTSGKIFIEDTDAYIERLTLLTIHGQYAASLEISGSNSEIKWDIKEHALPDGIYWMIAEGKDGQQGVARIVLQSAF